MADYVLLQIHKQKKYSWWTFFYLFQTNEILLVHFILMIRIGNLDLLEDLFLEMR
jgi:hypothetical protein